jgi:hypothetical protein
MLEDIKHCLMQVHHILVSTSRLTYASIGVGLLVAFLYFKVFFQDASQFEDDVENTAKLEYMKRSWFFPFRWLNDSMDFQWSELKIFIWIGISVGSSILAYYQLPGWFPKLFR